VVNTRIKFFAIISIWIFLLSTSTSNLNADQVSNFESSSDLKSYETTATFVDAWYADMEGDGFENDIVLIIKIDDFEFDKDLKLDDDHFDDSDKVKDDDHDDDVDFDYDDAKIILKVELVLPSGYTFSYYIEKKVVNEEFVFLLILYNHAIEQGWYWGHVTIVDNNYFPLSEKESIYFDPPGAMSGGTPRIT